MGLDIRAYSGMGLAPEAGVDSDGYPVEWQKFEMIDPAWNAEAFADRAGTFRKGVYRWAASHSFRAGSYSGYNAWRESLAEMAGYRPVADDSDPKHTYSRDAWNAKGGPFWELINFSDCEGVIGAEIAAKLAADFAQHQEKADGWEDAYWRERYADWRKALDLASAGGAVLFR